MKSPEELVLIARYFFNINKKNLIEVIDKNLKDKNQQLLKEILFNNIMPHELFAEKINSAIKGIGTNEENLTRVLISRCDIDMPLIREIYDELGLNTAAEMTELISVLGELVNSYAVYETKTKTES